jgi:hypothetical protein
MTPRAGRSVVMGLAAACTVQLTVAGVVIAQRSGSDKSPADVVQALDETPAPQPITPSGSAASTPGGSESPGPLASEPSAPPLQASSTSPAPQRPQAGQLSRCHDVTYVDAPRPSERLPIDPSGEDAGPIIVDGGAAYFTETKRDGSFATRLVQVDLATGRERHSVRDAFFTLTDVAAGHGWGVDHDGAVEIDAASGQVVRRWKPEQFPVDGADGLYNQPGLVNVDDGSAYVFGFDGPEVALSRIDVASGAVRWTTPLPVQGAGTGSSQGPRTIVGAYDGFAYVSLPMNLPDQDVLRVWRINGAGDVVQRRDIAVPDADTDGPSRLVVTAAGVYASVSTESDHLDATILRLDHSSLATMASVDVDVLEDLAASPDAVWAVTLQCNTFLWHRFTSDLASTGHPWALPDQSYTVAPAGDRVWSLRTREPMEAELVAGYPG